MQEDYGQWFARGRAHQKAGRPIDAIVCYRRALRSNRHAVQAQYRLGEALRDIGREDEAHRAWRDGLVLAPQHGGLLYCSAEVARRAGAYDEARATYRRVLAAHPRDRNAQVGHALSGIGLGEEAAYADLARTLADGASAPRWEELALLLAAAPPSAAQRELLRQLLATRAPELPPRLLALVAEALIAAGEAAQARQVFARAEQLMTTVDDPEVVRHIALAAAKIGAESAWAECYAVYCAKLFASAAPVLWPRRSAGSALRIAYLIAPDRPIAVGPLVIDPQSYLRTVIAGHPPERFSAVVYLVGEASPHNLGADWPAHVAISPLGAMPAAEAARMLGENDADVLIDLVGMNAPLGALLAQRPARSSWTYAALAAANVAPLITQTLPGPESGEAPALDRHRRALETMLGEYAASQAWFAESAAHSSLQLSTRWRQAVAAHQAGEIDAAVVAYRELLAEQPGYAPAHYLLGALLRGRGQLREAAVAFGAAIDSAPAYTEPRAALANLQREQGLPARATELCRQGLALAPNDVPLWRALGMARLAQHNGAAARDAFRRALELEPDDATTQYNHGVALQMLHRRNAALRAYQRALALDPQLVDADFNIGVIFRDKGLPEPAIKAFEEVLARAPRHVAAHKALAETLLAQRRLGAWFDAFDRFRAACPEALPLAVLALEACQYRADFAGLDFYLDGLRGDRFKASSETELADCLEELLFLLLYFDLDQDTLFGLYKAYDSIAPRVYGQPLALPETRRPGRIRIGYLSGDLRNHVMGKMMWAALERHDRSRFECFFYSLSSASDAWTDKFRALADHFEVVATLSEREAAEHIAAAELDILVDLSTNTFGAKPGILALKPARVQITHVASAGVVGLSTIDFKLTDAFADVAENQAFQLETLLPMQGCVYPYRHTAPAAEHPFRRDGLGLAPEQVLIAAFVNPLKLSRRCLALWHEVLERSPRAVLAISPSSPERRNVYARLFAAAGIPAARVCVLPQGRDDAENQARYEFIDFALDPLPYGGANGTLEAIDMQVPVVTLLGRKHGERSSFSILSNLGVTQTIASSGSEYVAIALRLATDPGFMAEVRAAIRSGLERSALTDMAAHTRHLEQAYVEALRQKYPPALGADDHG